MSSNPIQAGLGYGFSSSGFGFTLNTTQPFPEYGDSRTHPFQVINLGLVGESYSYRVIPGAVNSLVAQIGEAAGADRRLDAIPTPTDTWDFDPTTNQSYIYLKVSCDVAADPQIYPVDNESSTMYPRVVSRPSTQTNDAEAGWLLIASAYKDPETNVITITQLVFTSIGTERHQYENPELNVYYFWQS